MGARPPSFEAIASAMAPQDDGGVCGLRRFPRLLQSILPGRGLGAETALGAGAEPIAELRRHVAERSVDTELQGCVHRPVRVVEDLAADRDQVGLLVS